MNAGQWECIYANMPRFGLAEAGEHLPGARKGELGVGDNSAAAANVPRNG